MTSFSLWNGHAAELLFRQGVGGSVDSHMIIDDDSLVELARRYDVGFNEIMEANPGVDPFIPEKGTKVTIPGRWILPDTPRHEGIVINLAEMRLYHFPPHAGNPVAIFPIGIGDEGASTPTGTYRIVEKISKPVWHVPKSIRKRKPGLPKTVPPGPDNPLGSHALRLSARRILIHGTNRPFGIGRRVSHGCIRLYPEDIIPLFRKVRVGSKVTIIRQAVKAAEVDGQVLVEIHGDANGKLVQEAIKLLTRKGLISRVDLAKLIRAVRDKSGIPTDVGIGAEGGFNGE